MRLNIVIPMKEPCLSKTRLDPFLSSTQRQSIAMSMFEATLCFFKQHFSHYHLLVVTSSGLIAQVAKKHGANVLNEPKVGLRQAAQSAAIWSVEQGFSSQLLIPADIAHLDVAEIQTLLDAPRTHGSVIVAPAEDFGTNALLTTPPNVIPFLYGIDSSLAHQQAAQANGHEFQAINLPHLALDVDTPADIAQLVALANPLVKDLSLCLKQA